jgi:hypothetical protein
MPTLTRRRDPDANLETWQVFYGDVQVGTIGRRAGVPVAVDPWAWSLGFYPGTRPGEHLGGTAATLDQARDDFGRAWPGFLAKRTEDNFQAWRRNRAWTAWKYAMRDAGCRLPTQVTELRSRCFCGEEIGTSCEEHVYDRHMEVA